MIENDRLIAAGSQEGEEAIDRAMRPEKLVDYVGGHGSLALAWSDDLKNWDWPGRSAG